MEYIIVFSVSFFWLVFGNECDSKLSLTHGLEFKWSLFISINETLLKDTGVIIIWSFKALLLLCTDILSCFGANKKDLLNCFIGNDRILYMASWALTSHGYGKQNQLYTCIFSSSVLASAAICFKSSPIDSEFSICMRLHT